MTQTENNIVLCSITLCWASSSVFIKGLPASLSPFAYLTLTSGIASVLLLAVFFRRLAQIRRKTLLSSLLLSAFMAGNLLAEKAGLSFLSASAASFLGSLTILIVPLILLFLRRPPGRNSVLGIAVILLGLLATKGFQIRSFWNMGTLYMLVGCCFMAGYTMAANRFIKDDDPLLVGVLQICFSTVIGFALWMAEEPSTFLSLDYTREMLSSIFILAFFAKAYAYIALMYSQKYTNPLHVTIIASTEPVVTLALAMLIPASFGGAEQPTLWTLTGSAAIVSGTIIAGTHFPGKKKASAQAGAAP